MTQHLVGACKMTDPYLKLLRRPKCWFTRHHWLLQYEQPTFQPHVFTYTYQCQVCGKRIEELVEHLDD